MRVSWNPSDPPHQFHEVAPVQKVILAVCEAASSAASTGVADLEAAPEVDELKSIQSEIEPTNL